MPREVTDGDGVRWTCVQAYAGLAQSAEESGNHEAARVDGEKNRFRVVCTPSGAAQTAELELPGGWEETLSDDDLVKEIGRARA
ncbi:MAG: hypothetical protein ICV87_05040 [Gemmatimonadetes bacterium]|nr:hypothetical protein [Gemmatimonadota bacterium]